MKQVTCAFALLVLACTVVSAGVVIEMEVAGSEAEGGPAVDRIYAEGNMLRIDPWVAPGEESMSVIFRDDTMWFLDHDRKRCHTIDQQSMEQVTSHIDAAMKQMEEQLSKLPPEQRAMMEEMMKGQMPQGMPGMGQPGPQRRTETGGTEKVGGYSCTVHTAYAGDEKIWEVCAAPVDKVAGGSEAVATFEAMSRFAEKLRSSVAKGPFAQMVDTPFHDMGAIGGFPIRVRTFVGGELESESTLKAVDKQDVDDALFSAPDGYKVESLADMMKRGH